MTEHLFENAKAGDELEIKGPLGKFILPEEIEEIYYLFVQELVLHHLEAFCRVFHYKTHHTKNLFDFWNKN